MSDDPRSYRVPVLRIADVSRDSGLNDENLRDDSFDFKAPGTAPQPAPTPAPFTALPDEPAVPVPAYIAPAPKEEIPVEVPGYMGPPLAQPIRELRPASSSPRTPLPKIVDPFEKQRAPDPLDIWEQAELKKSAPPVPPPQQTPVPQAEKVEPVAQPQPAPILVVENETAPVVDIIPNSPPASAYTYGTYPVQKTEELFSEKPVELPSDTALEQVTDTKTQALLNQALTGMGSANLSGEKTRPAPLAPEPTPTSVTDGVHTPPPSVPGSNLTALRERVLRAGEHKQAELEQEHLVEHTEKYTGPPRTPQAQELRRTFSEPTPSALKPTDDTVPQVRRELETTHARAIADVAEALHAIQQGDAEKATAPESGVPEPHTPTTEGAPFVVQPVQAPPTNEGVSTPRRTGIPMMRTFKSDVEKTINRDKVSVVKMISDQEVRRHDNSDVTVRKTKRRHFTIASPILLIITLILIIGAIALGVFISVVVLRPNVTDTVNTLFFANESVEYDATEQDRTALLQGLTRIRDSVALPAGQVMEVVLIERVLLDDIDTGQTRTVTGKEFLERVNARAPSTLVRTILDSFIIGVHAHTRQEPFIVLRAGYHENAFSGMLLWEETMDVDLSPFFGAPVIREEESAPQTTGTSSEINPSTVDMRDLGTFDDTTIANTATRVLRDANGDIRMVWAMPDTSTIIITTNPQTFEEIRNRMQAR